MSDDLHTPTTAAPTPGAESAGGGGAQRSTADKVRDAAPEPLTHAAQSAAAAVASAREKVLGAAGGANQAPAERPEILAAAAFAGGLVAAMILKRLSR
ncbi:MAG TPA: hypothetical protein VLA98_13470 [Solirubrobacteraceae bacterium]|nr:hypothetical protein [Solirubrobacteraceae bacterium]HSD79660.1 hypothetical protein [Solirubrobacteraceae bacterium]